MKKMKVGGSVVVYATVEEREWWADTHLARMRGEVGRTFRRVGAMEEEIEEMVKAWEVWRDTEGAWWAGVQCEVLCWM